MADVSVCTVDPTLSPSEHHSATGSTNGSTTAYHRDPRIIIARHRRVAAPERHRPISW